MKVLIIIPAKDEAETIGSVLAETREEGWADILVVNDCSNDETCTIAGSRQVSVMDLPIHLGAWGGIQAGMRYALKRGFDAAVTIDADGQHDPKFIGRLVEKLGKSGVVIGADQRRGGRGKKAIWKFLRLFSGLDANDLTSGFRAYSKEALELLVGYDSLLMDYQDVGVLLLCRNAGIKISEIPVKMKQRVHGNSKVFRNGLAIVHYLLTTLFLIGAKRW